MNVNIASENFSAANSAATAVLCDAQHGFGNDVLHVIQRTAASRHLHDYKNRNEMPRAQRGFAEQNC